MAKLRDFFNAVLNDNRIFTREDIKNMSPIEFSKNEKAIDYQLTGLGIPSDSELRYSEDVVFVHSYIREDGTLVRAHYRSKRGNLKSVGNNLNNGMTLEEQIIDTIGEFASKFLAVGGANLQNARNNFKYAKKNPHAHVVSYSDVDNKGLNELMNKINIPPKTRGVIYDINSDQSKKIFNSSEIQNYIFDNYLKLINNTQDSIIDINFTIEQNLKGMDNFLGLQHCKLYNPRISSDGYFTGTIIDYYDFEYRDYTEKYLENFFNYVNNWGYSMQEKGLLENQFNIYQIREKLW